MDDEPIGIPLFPGNTGCKSILSPFTLLPLSSSSSPYNKSYKSLRSSRNLDIDPSSSCVDFSPGVIVCDFVSDDEISVLLVDVGDIAFKALILLSLLLVVRFVVDAFFKVS